jgi:hypothetical protein
MSQKPSIMVINIRGTNASGKSTIARQLLTDFTATKIFGVLGPKHPEAYTLSVPGVRQPVFILGPYPHRGNTGGCDRVQPYDLILLLLDKYSPRGHILFEGSLVSDNYGQIGEWLAARGRDAVVLFLDTPLDVCLERLRARTANAGVKHIAKRYEAIKRVRLKFLDMGKVRVVDTSPQRGYGDVLNLLTPNTPL